MVIQTHPVLVRAVLQKAIMPLFASSIFVPVDRLKLRLRLHAARPRVRHHRGAGESSVLLPGSRQSGPSALQRLVRHWTHLLQAGEVPVGGVLLPEGVEHQPAESRPDVSRSNRKFLVLVGLQW